MPTYEYECRDCGHGFEVFQAMSEEPVKTCPECGMEVRRLINGGSGVIFKGSGFYVTDRSRGGSKSKGTSSDAAACAGCPAAAASGGSCPSGDSAGNTGGSTGSSAGTSGSADSGKARDKAGTTA